MADANILIEVDAKDLASPQLVKVSNNIKKVGEQTTFAGKLFGDLKGKVEGAGIPLDKMSGYMGSAGLAAGGVALATGAAVAGLGMLGVKAGQALAGLQDLSDQTGVSVESISKMSLVLKLSNMSQQDYANSLSKLTVNLGKNANEFKALGVSVSDPEKAFFQLKKIISETSDPIKKAEIANMAYGKSWKDMAPLLEMPQEEMQKLIDMAPEISSSQAQAGAKFADTWDITTTKLSNFGMTLGIAVLPYLQLLVDTLDTVVTAITPVINFMGQMIGASIRLGSAILEKIKPIIADVFEPLTNTVKTLWEWFNKLLEKVGQVGSKLLGMMGIDAKAIINGPEPSAPKPVTSIPELEKPIPQKQKGKTKADIAREQKEAQTDFDNAQYNDKVKREADLAKLLTDNKLAREKAEDERLEKAADEKKKKDKEDAEKKAKEDEQAAKDLATKIKDIWTSFGNSMTSILSSPFEGFIKNVTRGNQSVFKSFKEMFDSILDSFGNMLVQMVSQYMAKAAIFGILGLATGGMTAAPTGILGGLLGFNATGTDNWRGGLTVVGERGPEIINVPRNSSITPMNEFKNMKSGDTYNINITNPTEKLTDTTLIKMGQRNSAFLKEDKVHSWRV